MSLENLDFRDLSVAEAMEKIKALKKPGLEPLVRWIAQGHAYTLSNQHVREAIDNAELRVESLINQKYKE